MAPAPLPEADLSQITTPKTRNASLMRPISLWKVKRMDLSFNTAALTSAKAVHYAFGSEDRITIEGTEFRAINYNEIGWLMQAVDGAGACSDFPHERLSRLASMGRLRHEPHFFNPTQALRRLQSTSTLISSLGKRPKARLSKRSAWVAAIRDMQREGKLKMTDESRVANNAELLLRVTKLVKSLSPLGEENPGKSCNVTDVPSPRTLRRWLKEAALFGDIGLADNMHKRGNRNRLMGPEEKGLLDREIRKYCSLERPTQRIIYDKVCMAFDDRNADRSARGLHPLITPSRETVRRAILSMNPFNVMVAREGLEAARKKYMPVGMGLQLTRPGERVEIDENTFDLISVMHSSELWDLFTEEERHAVGLDNSKNRWVLTVAICAATRCILGMVISRGAKPTAALQCLQMVVSDKGQWADAVRARGSWDMHLTPELIVTDNGTAFKSEVFRFACADLGISVEHGIAGMPQLRARNERFFETMANAVPPLSPGRTFSDIITKGDADPRERAALTFDDVAFALVRWIVDGYHNTPHRGLGGETPLQCWRRLTAEYGVTPPPDSRRWRMVFGNQLTRSLNKEGLEVLGVRYHSELLALWMDRNGEGKLDVRWHPRDIGAIEVLLGNDWFEVPAVDSRMEGKAAQTWLTAWRNVRAAHPARKATDRKIVHDAMKAIEERNATAMAMAGLLVNEWTEARIAKEERDMFLGAFPGPAPDLIVDGNGPGRAIPASAGTRPADTAKPAAAKHRKTNVTFEE